MIGIDNPDALRPDTPEYRALSDMERQALHHKREAQRIRAEIRERAMDAWWLTADESVIVTRIATRLAIFLDNDQQDWRGWPGVYPVANMIVRRVLRCAP